MEIIVVFVALFLFILGVNFLIDGEFWYAILTLFTLPVILLVGIIYNKYIIKPKREIQNALHRMYKFPYSVKPNNELWSKSFLELLNSGLNNVSDPNKKSDLKHCRQIVDKMTKEGKFESLHRAFKLTGCHFIIKDSEGRTVTNIV